MVRTFGAVVLGAFMVLVDASSSAEPAAGRDLVLVGTVTQIVSRSAAPPSRKDWAVDEWQRGPPAEIDKDV
jgi:hypothetical protein